MELEEVLKERIFENEELFSKNELSIMNSNIKIMKKIYLLGLINGKQAYGKKIQ